jgi:hypothetical protein
MLEPTPTTSASSSSTASDLPLAAGATLLTFVAYLEPAARFPAGALTLSTLLLLWLGAVRRRSASTRSPRV